MELKKPKCPLSDNDWVKNTLHQLSPPDRTLILGELENMGDFGQTWKA